MIQIPLSRGLCATIDNNDVKLVANYNWYTSFYGYAVTTHRGKKILMHRLISRCPEDMQVDHIDRNPLNNTRNNIRICESHENQRNRRRQSNNTSGYRGVVWHKQRQKWFARVYFLGHSVSMGLHDTKEQAALAYNKGARLYYGDFAVFNKVTLL